MSLIAHVDFFPASEYLVTAVLFIPLGHRRILVHVFDDVSPTDTRVVGAEGNLTFLRAVRDDSHFCATKIVVEEILEPHAGDEKEVPSIGASLRDVVLRTITAHLAVVFSS